MAPVNRDWRSWRLKWWWMIPNIVVEAGLAAAIAALTWKSETQNGFCTIEYTPLTTLSSVSWREVKNSQLWWTLLPALFMALVGICFNTIVAATAEREPFVELNHYESDAKSAKLTLLLDYPSQALFYSWVVAFSNGHSRLGFAMLVQLITSVSLVSLAGNLFRANPVQNVTPIALESQLDFSMSSLTMTRDLLPALDVASAINAYGAAPPDWMTNSSAIRPFGPINFLEWGNMSVETSIYSAKLDCQLINRSDLNINLEQSGTASQGNVLIDFVDRECHVINQGFAVSSAARTYAISWMQECSGSQNWNVRLGIFFGTYSDVEPQNLANFTTISCIPSYHNVSALVAMNLLGVNGTQVISIDPSAAMAEMNDLNFQAIHQNLHRYATIDPSGVYKSDTFGRTVHTLATILGGDAALDPEAVLDATKRVYATLFAALVVTQLMQPLSNPISIEGNLTSTIQRLYVVAPIAYIVLVLLFMMCICSIVLFRQAFTSRSILREDPVGLLGKAAVLLGSDVFTFISNILDDNPGQKRVVKLVKDKYAVKESKCFLRETGAADSRRICLQNLKSKPTRMKKQFAEKWISRRGNRVVQMDQAETAPLASRVGGPLSEAI